MALDQLLFGHPFADGEGLLHTVDRSMTAGEARSRANEIAASLPVEPRQAVAVMLPNGPDLVCTFMAIWRAGAVFVPVNPRLPEPEVDAILTETGAAVLVDASGVHSLGGSRTFPEDVAFVTWTSGTTGRPKPILHTHTGYLELLDRVLVPLQAGRDRSGTPTPNLIPVSMALNAGLYNSLFGLRAGAALVIMDQFDPAGFADLVHRFSIRSTVLPPAAMVMLNDSDVSDLGPLRYVRSITAPLSPLQAQRFTDRFGTFVLNSYGQAEMGEVIGWTAADSREHPDKLGAAGRPLPGVSVRLDDEGHLLVRPPNAALGVDDRRDADGYIDTGDIATIDEDGFVWIDGRVSDLINRGGNKVFPDSVEEVLCLHPDVVEAGVAGVPDDRLGEVPVAWIVGTDVDPHALAAHCRERLAPYKVPVAFLPIDELPRSEVGKLLRRDLVQRWIESRLQD